MIKEMLDAPGKGTICHVAGKSRFQTRTLRPTFHLSSPLRASRNKIGGWNLTKYGDAPGVSAWSWLGSGKKIEHCGGPLMPLAMTEWSQKRASALQDQPTSSERKRTEQVLPKRVSGSSHGRLVASCWDGNWRSKVKGWTAASSNRRP